MANSITFTLSEDKAPQKPELKVPEKASKAMTWTNGEETIDYVATAETVAVRLDDGTLVGHMFALSYVSDDEDKTGRPVTFLWNGGPGGSSMMVNIGGMGPHRVPVPKFEDDPCPMEPVENPYTLLPSSDLVFLDAFGTGYSILNPEYDEKKVYGVDGDADAFVRAIAAWMSLHNRWNSPLYIYGESYGTFRNAVVMRLLGERGIGVTGVIEQSSILDWADTTSGNDLYYLGMTPVYAATANWFGKAGKDVDQFEWFDKAWEFVEKKMATALVSSDTLTPEEERAVAEEMSELIGLDADYIANAHLRIELDDFRRTLLKDEHLFTGRYDTRFTEPDYMQVQNDEEFFCNEDPSMDCLNSPYTGAWMKLVEETGYKGTPNYIGLNMLIYPEWDWTHQSPATVGSPQCPNVAYDMGVALRRNPKCRVLFFGGIHDAATPFWNAKHSITKLFLPEALNSRIEYHVHENGHMAYADDKVLAQMAPELKAFYDKRHEDGIK